MPTPLRAPLFVRGAYAGGITGHRQGFSLLPSLSSLMSLSLHSIADLDSDDLRSVIEHVFLPPNLPHVAQRKEAERGTNVALCHILKDAAAAFRQYYSSQELVWARMEKMIEYIRRAASSPLAEANLEDVLAGLDVNGGLKLPLACHMTAYIRFQMSS